MITIVDCGIGNLGSVINMFKRLGVASRVAASAAELLEASRILLPGVGAFDSAMSRLNESGLVPILERKALQEKVPILGICLGMQLLTRGSEEGQLPGLSWIPAETRRFRHQDLKVPHMGWNRVYPVTSHPLTANLPDEPRFYFVHSYYVATDDRAHVLMSARYGHDFDAVIWNGRNVYGAQFHPEKSHRFGMRLLENFARLP